MAVQGWQSHRALPVGLENDRLRSCPNSPNCVSSDAPQGSHHVSPLPLPKGDAPALSHIRATIEKTPRTRVITARDDYLHAEFETLVFRFVDDLEVHVRPGQKVVAVRSASRVGHWDLGTNRRRVERLRRQLTEPADP
jgi:uncharacterized protein (DUF1499 family)